MQKCLLESNYRFESITKSWYSQSSGLHRDKGYYTNYETQRKGKKGGGTEGKKKGNEIWPRPMKISAAVWTNRSALILLREERRAERVVTYFANNSRRRIPERWLIRYTYFAKRIRSSSALNLLELQNFLGYLPPDSTRQVSEKDFIVIYESLWKLHEKQGQWKALANDSREREKRTS